MKLPKSITVTRTTKATNAKETLTFSKAELKKEGINNMGQFVTLLESQKPNFEYEILKTF